jgi:hypothetical protein
MANSISHFPYQSVSYFAGPVKQADLAVTISHTPISHSVSAMENNHGHVFFEKI